MTLHKGASGGTVRICRSMRTGVGLAWKHDPRPGQIERQVRNSAMLCDLFGTGHVVRIVGTTESVMAMQAVEGPTIHELVVKGGVRTSGVLDALGTVWSSFGRVWQATAATLGSSGVRLARDPVDRVRQIRGALVDKSIDGVRLCQCLDLPLRINGERYPTLRTLLDRVERLYEPPKRVVLCHGDPHGQNIIISRDGHFVLIDPEWSGVHDPRISLGRMLGWWWAYGTHVTDSSIVIGKQGLEIEYAMGQPARVSTVARKCWQFAQGLGRTLAEPDWRRQVQLQVNTYLLGEQRFLSARGEQHRSVPLLGAALQGLAALPAPASLG